MAEYHLHAQVIKRRDGRRVVACAAYRAGAKLFDETLGITWNFSRKPGVEHSEILAPDGAPAWMLDREKLWNAVEWTERHKYAQLAREFDVSLPVELDPAQQLELTRAFIREQLVSRGMVCDFSIHREDAGNPHFHVMATMREIDGQGFARTKQRAWNDKALLLELRACWEHAANHALAFAGHAARIDHRSFADRGIALEPQPKLGRKVQHAHLDGRDVVAERTLALQAVAYRNGERIIADPEIALRALTSKRATFSESDLYKLVHRHTAESEQFENALARVRQCRTLVRLPREPGREQRYSTREIVAAERSILDDAHLLAQRAVHRVDDALVDQALALAPRELNPGQVHAVRHVTRGSDFAIVEGFAGTGKSTMLEVARVAWEAQGCVVVGGALAGKAAEGLQQDSGIPSRTLHAWQWRWETKGDRLTSRHVFVIDEAAMVGTAQFQKIIDEVRRAGAKLVLVGDTQQLKSIEPGAPMRLLKAHYEPAVLSTIIRQKDHAWQREATLAFATNKDREGLEAYATHDRVHGCTDATAAQRALVETWAAERLRNPADTTLLLAYRRKDVHALNQIARQERKQRGEIGRDHLLEIERGLRAFSVGDRVFFLKNDTELDVKNGTLGTIEHIAGSELSVRLDKGTTVAFNTRKYNAFDLGYAGTIHKSQGATVDRTYLLASRYMDAEASYVALTRHRRDAQLFYSREEFTTPDTLLRQLSRRRPDLMAHDLLLPADVSTRKLERRLARELRAASVRPADRTAALEALRVRSLRSRKSTGEMLASLPEIRQLTAQAEQAQMRLEAAEGRLRAYEDDHPHLARLRLGDYPKWLGSLERARAELEKAQAALSQARARSENLDAAERMAGRHNRSISEASKEWAALSHAQTEQARRAELALYVVRENTRANALRLRTVSAFDRGRRLDCERQRDDDLFVLRDRAGGPLVVATAQQCIDHGWSTHPSVGFARTRGHAHEHEPGGRGGR